MDAARLLAHEGGLEKHLGTRKRSLPTVVSVGELIGFSLSEFSVAVFISVSESSAL